MSRAFLFSSQGIQRMLQRTLEIADRRGMDEKHTGPFRVSDDARHP